ncbi:S26 family signal peptidase [Caulobacter sp. RHG1]|uniref:S26 family signal peptidase n=1 Tax=Caulobacter sp. (strain RHG1) TaxID=2545762 RepID=UPI0019D6883F|nr:S26 family signal peptidase [Caulobacter sp. RHG1]NQE61491.1 Type IV secretory pathway, protease TraF [Caulobacter sp. RHG1]
MTARFHLMTAAGFGCALILAPLATPPNKRLIYNATSSAPLGFYWLGSGQPVVGDLALVRPPLQLARWMAARRYLPLNVPLIKRVAAVQGQVVCIQDDVVTIDGRNVGAVLKRDRAGRLLNPSTICRPLRAEEVFLLNTAPRSLDGRYFGPLPRQSVVGRLTPLWTWGR